MGVYLSSCSKNGDSSKQDADTLAVYGDYQLHLDTSFVILDSILIDLSGDGTDEAMLTFGERALQDDPMTAGSFQRLQVFQYSDMDSLYKPMFVDVFDYGSNFYFRDVLNTGNPEIVVEVDAGGNNPILSRGIHIYGYRNDNTFSLLFYSSGGNPEFEDLNDDGVQEILVTGEYWGTLERSESITFTEEIYAFNGTSYAYANSEFGGYFNANITQLERQYRKTKRSAKSGDPGGELYKATIELFLWVAAKGDAEGIDELWAKEKDLLRESIPFEQYNELQEFVRQAPQQYSGEPGQVVS